MKKIKIKQMDRGVKMDVLMEEFCTCGCEETLDVPYTYCFNEYAECMDFLNNLYKKTNKTKLN